MKHLKHHMHSRIALASALATMAMVLAAPAHAQGTPRLETVAIKSAPRSVNEIFTIYQTEPVGGDVSQIEVPPLSMTGASFQMAMDLALADKGLSTSIRTPLSDKRSDVAVRGVRGNLEQVLNQLGQSYDFFWVVKDGLLVVDGTRTFSLSIPSALASDRGSFEKSLTASGATEVRSLALDNIVIFRASPSALDAVRQVLEATSISRGLPSAALRFGTPVVAQAPAPVTTSAPALAPQMAASPLPAVVAMSAPAPVVVAAQPVAVPVVPAPMPVVPAVIASPALVARAQAMAPRAPSFSSAPAAAKQADVEPRFWGINVTDRTVEGVLRRWAREQGWSLRYEFDRIPVLRPASVIAGDFLGAAKQIQLQLVEAGYQMDLATIGTTLRVSTGASK